MISPKDLKSRVDNGEQILVLDVRDSNQTMIYPIGGNAIPHSLLSTKIPSLMPHQDKLVAVVCNTGNSSGAGNSAKRMLESRGFSKVEVVQGGAMRLLNEIGRHWRFKEL